MAYLRFLLQALVAFTFAVNVFSSANALEHPSQPAWDAPHNANPFIPGYYADASVLQTAKETFVYATEDPWGGRTLGCWRSSDLEHWRWCSLNWPTKEAATSPTSGDSMIWAPSVVAKNGRYYMYVSVGSEVWVGVAGSPAGPWKNALGSKPLIPGNYRPGFHMIDAEVFLDTDGQAYLYWGSGLRWVNGHCFVVKLKADMVTFDGEPRDVTPAHYFEAPFMYKHGGRYFLMYSEGKTTDSTYNVRYAVGTSPLGPFREGANSPLLVSDPADNILGPGHHAVFERGGRSYIVYHRHSLPFDSSSVRRQLCMDELTFSANGEPQKVVPTHLGPALLRKMPRSAGTLPVAATASSSLDASHDARRVIDDNYATRWSPASDDENAWLELDLHKVMQPRRSEIRFEYAWKPYRYRLLASVDGKAWTLIEDQRSQAQIGSPVVIAKLPRARYLRLEFPRAEAPVSIFEWSVY